MAFDIQTERLQVHALIDLLPPIKLGAVRNLLELMVDVEADDELTEDDCAAIRAGLASLDKNGGVSMETVLADFGLTLDSFEKLTISEVGGSVVERNG